VSDHPPLADLADLADLPPAATDPPALLDALRAKGAARREPLHFAFLEALARRTATRQGEARRVLDQRLAAALAALVQRLAEAETTTPTPASPPEQPTSATSPTSPTQAAAAPPTRPLASLLGMLRAAPPSGVDAAASTPGVGGAGNAASGKTTAPAELKAVSQHRRTWTRLRTEQRLQQSRASVPENAGPLHSQALVLRLLTQLQALSPDYLAHFVSHVDALLWLEQAGVGALPLPRHAPPAAPATRPAPGASASPAPPRRSRAKR